MTDIIVFVLFYLGGLICGGIGFIGGRLWVEMS